MPSLTWLELDHDKSESIEGEPSRTDAATTKKASQQAGKKIGELKPSARQPTRQTWDILGRHFWHFFRLASTDVCARFAGCVKT